MKPNVTSGGGSPAEGLLPANHKDVPSGQGAYSPGYPTFKPVVASETSPKTASGNGVPPSYQNVQGNVAGGKNEYAGGSPPRQSAGTMPPSGFSKRPASRTSPTNKSKDVGVE